MHIVIAGGAGFIGDRVAAALDGHDVVVFHRGAGCRVAAGLRHVHGDCTAIQPLRELVRSIRPDVVVDMRARNAADAEAVIAAIDGLARRAVVISSGSVYRTFGVLLGTEDAEVDNTAADEAAALRRNRFPYRGRTPRLPSDPRRWLDDYDKIPVEQAFTASRTVPATIVRLPMVYGPGDPDQRLAGYLRRMADRRPVILLQQRIAAWRNSRAYVDNVAAAIARVVVDGEPGRVYNVAEPDDLSEAEWVRRIGERLGWDGSVRAVPDGGAIGRLAFDEFPVGANFAQHLRLDSTRIRRELGYQEVVPSAEALRRTVAARTPLPAVDYSEEDRWLMSGL